jgi:hypothetical protein
MTTTPAPNNLEEQFTNALKLHENLDSITTQADRQMLAAIQSLRCYRKAREKIQSSKEVDYGLLAQLTLELELVIYSSD